MALESEKDEEWFGQPIGAYFSYRCSTLLFGSYKHGTSVLFNFDTQIYLSGFASNKMAADFAHYKHLHQKVTVI